MAMYSDAELEALMSDLESDLVERKEAAADGRKIRRNVCAFANDLPGNGEPGVVLIGVPIQWPGCRLSPRLGALTKINHLREKGQCLGSSWMAVGFGCAFKSPRVQVKA